MVEKSFQSKANCYYDNNNSVLLLKKCCLLMFITCSAQKDEIKNLLAKNWSIGTKYTINLLYKQSVTMDFC